MTLEQRAQQFWSVLVFAALEQKVISYSMLAQITAFTEDPAIVLYYIYCYCRQYQLPSLNVIVVDPATGRPGDEFPRDLRDLSAQQSRVFLHDWLRHPAPSDEIFHEVMRKEDELEKANAEYVGLSC
jgi:hypothetical protein